MGQAVRTQSPVSPVDDEEVAVAMLGPEMGLLGLNDKVVDEIAISAVRDFLDSIDPAELEVRATSLLGGLVGEESVGSAMLKTLREMAGVE